MSQGRAFGARLGFVGLVGIAAAGPGPREEDPTAAAPAARALDPRSLRAAYLDLAGRPPFAKERELWSGSTLEALVEKLVGSREFWRHWYQEQLYYFLLIDNFRPQGERLESTPDELAGGALDVREAVHRVALSSSFDQRNPGADTFVTVLMEQLDGLEVQSHARELELGKKIYDGASAQFLGRPGSTQADLVQIAIEHERFAESFLAREYRRVVRAEPAREDLARWVREFRADPLAFVVMVREWVLSPPYEERLALAAPMSNRLFVRALFVDLAGRPPGEDEARRMCGALDGLADPAPLRAVLARLLVDSRQAETPRREEIEDAPAWIEGLFPRLLGREASARELAVFCASFSDPACRPQTIVYALVSHPEYARY